MKTQRSSSNVKRFHAVRDESQAVRAVIVGQG
jgi:hypothetical protein